MIVITRAGAKYLMWGIRYRLSVLLMGLFINDHQPGPDDTSNDYAPATFPGYSLAPLSEWGYPFTDASGSAEVDAPIARFTQTALPSPVQVVYGYFVIDSQGNLVYAERTEAKGYPMSAAPLTYEIFPTLSMADLT